MILAARYFIFSILLFLASSSFGQLEIKTTPLSLLYLRTNLQIELPVLPKFSLEMVIRKDFLFKGSLGANLYFNEKFRSKFNIDGKQLLGEKLNITGIANNIGLSIAGKYFFHPREAKLDRFYAFGYLKYRNYWLRDNNLGIKFKYRRISPGIGLGLKWIFGQHFVFDTGTGMGYSVYHGFSDNIPFTPSINFAAFPLASIDLYSRISLGYRF